ncbi:hypothetical protein [Micromonospora sp. NBC_01796]|uniref:hypothetical protein n=1 Tax=Micromonospora sp. NBC_01796 TaxID=2975987 RepID=UPI002DD8A456|nr:hypothetical protein [Micromonospora sp. NBC_01796]WSA84529.1 hypothetical protein OIE47_29855 [Micromonospora sp. NBC_01796]
METDRVTLPDLTLYRLQRSERDAEFEGVAVPGLVARFYHRDEDGRTATVGRYWYAGRELLMAWGYADEEHCRASAVRGADGRWHPPTEGCPTVRVVRERPEAPVAGFEVQTPSGNWIAGGTTAPVPAG